MGYPACSSERKQGTEGDRGRLPEPEVNTRPYAETDDYHRKNLDKHRECKDGSLDIILYYPTDSLFFEHPLFRFILQLIYMGFEPGRQCKKIRLPPFSSRIDVPHAICFKQSSELPLIQWLALALRNSPQQTDILFLAGTMQVMFAIHGDPLNCNMYDGSF